MSSCGGRAGIAALSLAVATVAAQVEIRPAAVDPGGIAVAMVADPAATPERVTGTFRGRALAPFTGTDGRVRALVGVDLDTPPGRHEVRLELRAAGGPARVLRGLVEVRAKRFPREDLTVAEKYVEPDAATLARIHRETAALDAALGARSSERLWRGSFLLPADGPLGSPFGLQRYFNGQPRRPHMGQDLRVPEGVPVIAAARGRVVLAAAQYFGGNTLVLDHGLGLFTMYLHLAAFHVREGSLVERGDLLGYAGKTGRATGAHLHWAAHVNGTRVDPLPLLHDPAAEHTEVDHGEQGGH